MVKNATAGNVILIVNKCPPIDGLPSSVLLSKKNAGAGLLWGTRKCKTYDIRESVVDC